VEPDESGTPAAVVLGERRLAASEVLTCGRIDDEQVEEISRCTTGCC
jgi:hypothetical protein